jgi:hypothetical protein
MPGVTRCALAVADTDRRFGDVFGQTEYGCLAIEYGASEWADPILIRLAPSRSDFGAQEAAAARTGLNLNFCGELQTRTAPARPITTNI